MDSQKSEKLVSSSTIIDIPPSPRVATANATRPTNVKHRYTTIVALFVAMIFMGPIYFTFLAKNNPPTRSFLSHPDRLPYSSSPNAFVTYLDHTPTDKSSSSGPEDDDTSFTNARILSYQLLHDPKTRSNASVPLVIFVPRTYPEAKIQRLTDDGAVVISVDGVTHSSAIQKFSSYNMRTGDRLEKLRMLELYEFDLICYISPDTLLTKSLDGVFQDDAVTVEPSKGYTDGYDDSHERHEEKATGVKRLTVPATYLFAASATKTKEGTTSIFSERMFVVRPSLKMFDYYAALASRNGKKGHCDDLFNRAHGETTRMPWRKLGKRWEQEGDDSQEAGATLSSERQSLENSLKARALWKEKRDEMEQSLGKL